MTGKVRCLSVVVGMFSALLPGCLNVFNPAPSPPRESKLACELLPLPSRQRVYVVLVNGADPFGCGNLEGTREYLGSLGFVKTYYAQLYHEYWLFKELRDVHAEHPDAHFAIIGFEYGAGPARSLALKATENGIPVDLLIYLQPKTLGAELSAVTPSISRTITIQAGNNIPHDAKVPDENVIDVPCSNRYGVPTHPNTLATVATELFYLATTVPFNLPNCEPFKSIMDDPAPPPRPIIASNEDMDDEWDFLKLRIRKRTIATEVKPPADTSSSQQTSIK